jgi:hypothetical protein
MPATATDVLDLAIWAAGLPPTYRSASDYDCSGGSVDVVDLGVFAGGLVVGCTPGAP